MSRAAQLKALAKAWEPPERLDVVDWAERHVVLPPSYAVPGQFRVGKSRYLIEPLRAATQDATVREVTICKGIQTGGSLVAELSIAWHIANSPCPIMWTMQSDEDAKEHCRGRFNALLRGCRPVRDMFPVGSRHDITNTQIWFGDFFLLVNGANKNNLQSKSIRFKVNSECWLWDQGLLKQAKGRVSAFERAGTSKVLNESQGCVSGHDFEKEWLDGSRQEWSVRCSGCGKLHALDFFGRCADDPKRYACVVWDEQAVGEHGKFNEQRVRDSVRWRCPSCGHEHDDSDRTRALWNNTGDYTAGVAGVTKRRSFRWNSLTGHSLGDMAVEWLNACIFKGNGIIAPTRDFYMQRLAQFWRVEEEHQTATVDLKLSEYTLAGVAADPLKKFPNEVLRKATIDRQRDHFWMILLANSADGESWILWRGKVLTIEGCIEIADKFGLLRHHVFEDAQHDTNAVYQDCVKYGIVALHGSGQDEFTWELQDGSKVGKFYSRIKRARVPGGEARYIFWASDPIKSALHASKTDPKWHIPADIDVGLDPSESFTRQMNGEQQKERINKSNGHMELRWTRVWANHFWDCMAMHRAMDMALGLVPGPERKIPNGA